MTTAENNVNNYKHVNILTCPYYNQPRWYCLELVWEAWQQMIEVPEHNEMELVLRMEEANFHSCHFFIVTKHFITQLTDFSFNCLQGCFAVGGTSPGTFQWWYHQRHHLHHQLLHQVGWLSRHEMEAADQLGWVSQLDELPVPELAVFSFLWTQNTYCITLLKSNWLMLRPNKAWHNMENL